MNESTLNSVYRAILTRYDRDLAKQTMQNNLGSSLAGCTRISGRTTSMPTKQGGRFANRTPIWLRVHDRTTLIQADDVK
jgi:hypothetical protein